MKPISSLKAYRSGTTPVEIIRAFLRVVSNPKRHLRGPLLGKEPGNGKIQDANVWGDERSAVCGCASGIMQLVRAPGRQDAMGQARFAMDIAAGRLFPGTTSCIWVSDHRGLRAIRKVARAALADLQAPPPAAP